MTRKFLEEEYIYDMEKGIQRNITRERWREDNREAVKEILVPAVVPDPLTYIKAGSKPSSLYFFSFFMIVPFADIMREYRV